MFIDDHADCGIGVNDIAAALNVSPRSVQYLFRRHLRNDRGVTVPRASGLPTRDLQCRQSGRRSVTAIAVRWGFTHAGRFSVAYRGVRHRPECDAAQLTENAGADAEYDSASITPRNLRIRHLFTLELCGSRR